MNLEARKIQFVQDFLRLQNEEVIKGLEKLLKKHKAELYEENMRPMSVEKYNADINQSLEDSENDRGTTAKELKAEIKKWR